MSSAASSAVARPVPSRTGAAPFDLLQAAVMLMVLVSVWRIHLVIPQLNFIKIQFLAPALGVLALATERDPRRQLRRILNPLLYKLLGVGAMVALSVPTSLWPGYSFNFLTVDFSKTLLLMVLMAASIRSVGDLDRYALIHLIGATLYCGFVLTHFEVSESGRLGDLGYYDANDLALLLVCTIPFCVFLLRPGAKPLYRVAAIPVLALIVSTMVKTGSRGGFLGFIACGLYLTFTFGAVRKTVRIYAVGSMVAFLMIFGREPYWNMMSSLLHPTQDYNYTEDVGRWQIWKRGIGYMVSHPLTGVGAAAFGTAEGTLSSVSERQRYGIGFKWSAAHNSFVQVGAELGVVGLGLFLAALWQAWRFVRGVGRGGAARAGPLGAYGHTIGGVLVAYVVSGFFLSAGYSPFLYSVFALVIGVIKILGMESVPNSLQSRGRGARQPGRWRRGGPSPLAPPQSAPA